jgi:hypothetical protein
MFIAQSPTKSWRRSKLASVTTACRGIGPSRGPSTLLQASSITASTWWLFGLPRGRWASGRAASHQPRLFSDRGFFSGATHYLNMKSPGLDTGAPPFQRRNHAARMMTRGRESTHSSISSAYHATRQAPSCNLFGNFPAPSRRAMCAKRDSVDSLQFLLRYEIPCHCKSLL